VSRSTSYATPIPIWRADDGSEICVGSITELEDLTKVKLDNNNIHPEMVDNLYIERDSKIYKRISDTFDCWFESGCVPMAQIHYPFAPESLDLESKEYLSDFICEGMDQTRGWFYTLMVLSTAIFDRAPYRNVMCTGMVLDANGDKLSKRLGNFIDPTNAINEFGADIIRTYFINSPAMNAEPLKFDEKTIMFLKRRFTPYIGGVRFWIEHTMNFMKRNNLKTLDLVLTGIEITNLMDEWILLRTNDLVTKIRLLMEDYRFSAAIELLLDFIDELTNWYIKFNRDRIKGTTSETDCKTSICVLYNVLMTYCRLWTPFTPFMSEHIFQYLRFCSTEFTDIDSVLLTDYPKPNQLINYDTNKADYTLQMFKDLQRICTLVRCLRNQTKTHSAVVVPLKRCTIYHNNTSYLNVLKTNINLIQGELNCQEFMFESLTNNVSIKITPDRKMIGKFFRNEASNVVKFLESQSTDTLSDLYNQKTHLEYKTDTLDETIDSRFYSLTKIPLNTFSSEHNTLSMIDNDLMVSIDHTYDEQIHNAYQYKRIHTAVQKSRKEMGLRPWHNITVILDDSYANSQTKQHLQNSLTNAVVIIADFTNDVVYGSLVGVDETDVRKIHGQEFKFESFSKLGSDDVTGRLIVHYRKRDDLV